MAMMRRRCRLLYYNGAAVIRSAPVYHGLTLMTRIASVNSGALVHGTVAVRHGPVFTHAGSLMACPAFVNGGTVFMHNRTLLLRRVFMHGRTLTVRRVLADSRSLMSGAFLHRAALLPGNALLRRRSCLVTGTVFRYRPDLLRLCRFPAACRAGYCCFGNSHQERSA